MFNEKGWLSDVRHKASPFFNQRPDNTVTLLVIHNISLPPNQYGSENVIDFFQGKLDAEQHPFFASIAKMQVSAHFWIRRCGEIVQFVSVDERAWHAGVSSFQGCSNCNDYSIGVELEGSDFDPYTEHQYIALAQLTQSIRDRYPEISLGRIVGHNDIAPGRKTDPGPYFDWPHYRGLIKDNK